MYLLCTITTLIYYVLSVHLLSVVRLYSYPRLLRSLACLVPFSLNSKRSSFFALAFLFRSSRPIFSAYHLSLSLVVSHGRRGFPQAHSVRLAYHEEREEETKERIEFRFAVEAVAVTRSKRRRRRRTTTSTIKTTTRTTRTTTESLRPIRLAENASASRAPAFEVVVV